ncbi:MAG TPA: CCA tRNA nucleotidyltransferase [Candidatus Dormibacteraeota bacterium]|nr:CCA tRNA nucleotidyltransferase [Candidatus Dormibacteraeota bacterium]
MGADQPVAGSDVLGLLKQAAVEEGATAWIVGGYVRDKLLGRPHPDPDVVVEHGSASGLAQRFARLAGVSPPVIFERFGTAQVTVPGHIVEFVSARAESYPPDSRKPVVRPASLADDINRRDFTINTLLMDFDGNISDPLGRGRADLDTKLLRTPLDPAQTFSDDPLRMLRGVRFAAQLGFELAPEIPPAMREMKGRLAPPVISAERIADELRKMLESERPRRAIELLDEGGLLEVVLPEVAECKGVEQGGFHTHDVYGHTLEALQLTEGDIVLRLAALFHDVGKPRTATPDGAFTGHEEVGAQMAIGALERLRFAQRDTENVALLVRLHLRPVYYRSEWSDGAVRRLARDAGDQLERLMALARADLAASAYPDQAKLDELQQRLDRVLTESPSRLAPPVDGADIMRIRHLAPGPEVGRIKARLAELIIDGEVPADRDAILAYLEGHPHL